MPRPKRTKIISDHAKAQAAAATIKENAAKQQIKAVSSNRDQTTTHEQASPQSSSNGTTRSSKCRSAARPFLRQDGVEIAMSGGLGAGDVKGAHRWLEAPTTLSQGSGGSVEGACRNSKTRPALAELSPLHGLNENAGATVSKKRSSTVHKSPWQYEDTASAPLDDGFEDYLRSSSPHLPTTVISRPASASRVQGTPSFLSMANFKRRPRQPSILRMVQQQTATDAENEDDSVHDVFFDAIGSSPADATTAQSPSSRKRKSSSLDVDEPDLSSPELQNRANNSHPGAKKQRKSTTTQEAAQDETNIISASNSPDLPSPAQTNHPIFKKTPPPRRRGRRIQPKHLAPKPVSTSSPPTLASSPHSTPPSSHANPPNKSQQQRQNARMPAQSRPKRTKAEQAATRQTITTASLQNLLPRRRARAPQLGQQGTFDVLSSTDSVDEASTSDVIRLDDDHSGETIDNASDRDTTVADDDEDELSKPQRLRRTRGGHQSKAKGRMPAKRTGKAAVDESRAGKETSRTYSRRKKQSMAASLGSAEVEMDSRATLSDGEDDSANDGKATHANKGASAAPDTKKSQELAEAAKKFAAIDDWELSFESCDVNGGSSSPWR